jgi:hypothetical protein
MNGNLMYDMARQRMADQQRAARQSEQARSLRAIRRERRAKAASVEEIAVPAIPDFAAEMFDVARDAVPAPRTEEAGGRPTRTGR